MPALPVCLLEPVWVPFAALLPARPAVSPTHPLGRHRARVPDRVVVEHVVAALMHGSGDERVEDSPGRGAEQPLLRHDQPVDGAHSGAGRSGAASGRGRRLTADERAAVRRLAADVPALWGAPTTSADRTEVVRLLVDRVVVDRAPQSGDASGRGGLAAEEPDDRLAIAPEAARCTC